MSNSVSNELAFVNDLINEGKFEEALQHVTDLEQKKNLSHEEILRTQEFKGRLYNFLGQPEVALKIAEQLYQKSQEMKMPLFSLDALSLKEAAFRFLDRFGESFITIAQHEALFKSIPRENSLGFQKREANLIGTRGIANFLFTGNFDLALDDYNKSLTLLKQIDPHSIYIPAILMGMAYCYLVKGELDITLEYNKRALSLIPKGEYYYPMRVKADNYRSIGSTYYQKGDLDRALEYHLRGLEIYEKIKKGWWMGWSYHNIIEVFLAEKDLNQAQNYLKQFKQFNEKHKIEFPSFLYQLSYALVLKSSSRMRDHVEAETILKRIIKENATHFVTNLALIYLCDWYFEEFQISHQMEILDDIQPLIGHLYKNARKQNSYFLLANVKLFQAKLALLQVSMVEARKLLTEAQQIADEHGFQLLAGEISREHDRLLEELKLWESIKKTKSSVSERLKLASVDAVLERLQGKRAIELPEFDTEEPILLLIMDKSGVTYFNYSFVENWDFSDLFSSFMSAFNTFSGEIFSRSIDRIKIGENTILINPIEPFLACYIIKGQSYPAQQKLTKFSDTLKTTADIWDALDRALKTSETLELDNPPSLGIIVNEIFIR